VKFCIGLQSEHKIYTSIEIIKLAPQYLQLLLHAVAKKFGKIEISDEINEKLCAGVILYERLFCINQTDSIIVPTCLTLSCPILFHISTKPKDPVNMLQNYLLLFVRASELVSPP
jgi:hypothetical protein